MPEYLILQAPAQGWWVFNGSGHYVKVFQGQTTTLRADYVTSLGAYIQLVGGGGGSETVLTVRDAAGLDVSLASNWTQAPEDGVSFANASGNVELLAYFTGEGGGTRTVTVEGSPDLTLTLAAGEEKRTPRLSTARFGTTVLAHFDDHTGLYVMAVAKGTA